MRSAKWGSSPRHRRDDRLGLPSEGRAAPRHHADAARVSAVPDARRRGAASGDPAGHLSADVLGLHPQTVGAPRARSVPRRRPDRAGVDLRSEDPIGGERVGADADRAGDRTPAGAVARHPELHDRNPDQSRDQHPDGHAAISRAWCSSSAGPTTRSPATTPGRTASSAGRRSGPGSRRTSSSTTSRSRRRRTT